MNNYAGLASVYDRLVAGVDFDGWVDHLEAIMTKFDIKASTVVDLACGTGNNTLPLARRGYRTFGLDQSEEMLALARGKALSLNLEVTFIQGDMRDFDLLQPVDLIICFHDGLNYLTQYSDLVKVFQCVERGLVGEGYFVFDLNAVRWLSGTRPEVSMAEEDDLTLIWESQYHHDTDVWEVCLTGFARESEGDRYRKFREIHKEKAYTPGEVKEALSVSGLELLASFDAFCFNPVHENSRRHFYVAKKTKNLSGAAEA